MRRWKSASTTGRIYLAIAILLGTLVGPYGHHNLAEAAVPVVSSVVPSTFSSDTTGHNVAMPGSVASGALLITILTTDGTATVTTPSGWTELWTQVNTTSLRSSGYAKVASGSEGGTTVDFVTSSAEQAAAQVYYVTSWQGSLTNGVAVGTPVVNSDSFASPPTLSPGWTGDSTLWIVAAATSTTRTVTGAPSGYTNLLSTRSDETSASGQIGSAYRTALTGSENPGDFTFSGSLVNHVAQTIAIAPLDAPGDSLSRSSGYMVVEGEIGGSGQFDSSSGSYSFLPGTDDGGSSLGEFAVGGSSSANYSSGSGFNTTAQPGLSMVVNTSSINLGALSSAAASYGTATFDVSNYTSYGYVVTIIGTSPAYGSHSLDTLTTDTASSAGTEQFGINTVLNTSASQGANPVQIPDNTFSYGVAGDGITGVFGTTRPYTQSDKYRFISGETIASAPKSSGVTRYTATFMANISATNTPISPGGSYLGNVTFVATGTY